MTTQSDSQTMVKINPHEDTAILALSQEAGKLRDYALSRVILSDSDLSPATDDLSVIAKLKKALAEKKIEYLKPFKAHLEILNAAFTLITLPLEEADKITREKILAYRAAAAK